MIGEGSTFEESFAISGQIVGGTAPCFVIAEAGVAHFGDFELGRQLLELAITAKADAFKLQVYDVETLFTEACKDWRDRLRSRVLDYPQLEILRERCREAGIAFILTAHEESRIPWLESLEVDAVKVGSGERNNPGFISKLARLNRPMILSTGMHAEHDVVESIEAVHAVGARRLALLHCVSAYPTESADVNLRVMDRLRGLFPGPVGYSDHTEDEAAILTAVARGAQMIERHITILRDVPNAQDWKVSSGPEDFPVLVERIRNVERMLGHGRLEISSVEEETALWALKSLVAVRDLEAGHPLQSEDLLAKRPADGLPPSELPKLVGRHLRESIKKDNVITWDHLK